MCFVVHTAHTIDMGRILIARDTLDLPRNKAGLVAASLSEISCSDMVTCVAKSVQLAGFANEVRRYADDPEAEDVWDMLLALLQDLNRGEEYLVPCE
jgi:hypothetical protein